MILVDTGPLVALIHQDDEHHEVCKKTFSSIGEPLGTVWPVLTEAMYLLSFSLTGQIALWEMIESGAVELLALGAEDIARMTPSPTLTITLRRRWVSRQAEK